MADDLTKRKYEHGRSKWVWLNGVSDDDELRSTVLKTGLKLLGFVNPQLRAWMSQRTLAANTGKKLRMVGDDLRKLVERGWLVEDGWSDGCKVYKLAFPAGHRQQTAHGDRQHIARRKAKHIGNPAKAHRQSFAPTCAISCDDIGNTVADKLENLELENQPEEEPIIPPASPAGDDDPTFLDEKDDAKSKPDSRRKPPASKSRIPAAELDAAFEIFWRAFPRRVSKGAARKSFAKIVSSGAATVGQLTEGAERYAAERAGQEARYTKHPTTWLNAESWDDEPSAPAAPMYAGGGYGQPHDHMSAAEVLAWRNAYAKQQQQNRKK